MTNTEHHVNYSPVFASDNYKYCTFSTFVMAKLTDYRYLCPLIYWWSLFGYFVKHNLVHLCFGCMSASAFTR